MDDVSRLNRQHFLRHGLGMALLLLSLCALIGTAVPPTTAQTIGDHILYLPLVIDPTSPHIPFGPVHSGEGTYYTGADGSGNCGFPPTPNDLMVAAANTIDYDGSNLCGAYARATGPKGSVVVRIVDRCPGCAEGDLDFSPQAFALIADLPQGRVPISWQLVSPPLADPIVYHFKEGSSQWWTAVQLRHHRNPIAKFEYWQDGAYHEVPRLLYNYFVEADGMGPGPHTFRVTDYFGNQIVDSGVPLLNDASYTGSAQFPPPP